MPYDKTPTEMKGQKGMMMKGQQPMMMKGQQPMMMKGQQPMMMKDKGQPMMKYGGGPKMSAEIKFMPLTKDMIGGRASSIVNAGARSRMSGQPQMGHKGSPTGMHGPLHEVHKGKGGMPMYNK